MGGLIAALAQREVEANGGPALRPGTFAPAARRAEAPDKQGVRAIPEDLKFGFSDGGTDATMPAALLKLTVSLPMQAVVFFRLSQSALGLSPLLAQVVRHCNQALTGVDLSPHASVGPGLRLVHATGTVIAKRSHLGRRCTLLHGVTIGSSGEEAPRLGDRVYVGPGAKVIGGVSVGSHASIGANSVVISDIPERMFAAGIPAKARRESGHAP